jgi:phosphate:Na+ symporter
LSTSIAQQRRELRPKILERTASGELTPDAALTEIDALQWIDRVGYHLWRIVHHLSRAAAPKDREGDPSSDVEPPEPV